jgi:hypothetical protein
MHEGAFKFVAKTLDQLEPRYSVIELGSRTVAGPWPYSGPVRPLFNGVKKYLGVDIVEGPNVDVVGNAATWRPKPFKPVDTVVCLETLEHTPEAKEICTNAFHLLEPCGVLILTAAGEGRAPHSAVDGGPVRDGEFYRNVTSDELRGWLHSFGFCMIDTFTTPGDIYAVAGKLNGL